MKFAYFDCFAGASGDMILGSLLDAGLELERLKAELTKLHLTHYELQAENVLKKGVAGCQARVVVDGTHHKQHHRHLAEIKGLIAKSDLDHSIQQKSIEIFTRLAEAEARVHQTTIEQIHFHEVGAMDAIIDITGAVVGTSLLGIQKIFCSPLHLGSGMVECAHGRLPVPAPATAELVKGKPVYSTGVGGELLTPTGAAILTTLASDFGPMPAMSVKQIGYGAGTSDPSIPNLLRVMIGEAAEDVGDCEMEQVAVIETNIDDMNPQIYDYIIQKVLQLGALDIFLAPVQMKKNRSGTLATIICPPKAVEIFAKFLLQETTTIGLRWRVENRIKAQRTIKKINTKYGVINVKVAEIGGEIINITPEYEECKRVALEQGVPLKKVIEEVKSMSNRRF